MTTNQVGPLVEGQGRRRRPRARTGPRARAEEVRASFLYNLGYFWIGRFGGALAYFLPGGRGRSCLFLLAGPRDRDGWLALAGARWRPGSPTSGSIPDNWYGGGGTVGNRYFLSLLPLVLFLVPRGREWLVAAAGVVGLAVFLWPILLVADAALAPARAITPCARRFARCRPS